MSEPIVLAIDPGNEQSAYVVLCSGVPIEFGKVPNGELIEALQDREGFCQRAGCLAIETMKPRGMPTSFEEMQTQLWAGRFIQAFGEPFTQCFRGDIKIHHCGRATAKDKNIRQAMIDRFGGKEKAIGKKKTPGPLYGIANDLWQALAVATYWQDKFAAIPL